MYEGALGNRTRVKDLRHFQRTLRNPASISHVLTKYSSNPNIQYSRWNLTVNDSSSYVFMDYVVLTKASSSFNTYCHALSGYINQEYICDGDGETDRVNCPSVYIPDIGRNPASGRQCPSPAAGSNSDVRDAHTLTMIIIGSVFVALIVIFVIVALIAKRADAKVLAGPHSRNYESI
ncbi:uncharacterized protein LOC129596469 [Paramacrobiotus metropolitanus]|uniref:uncharacterized protein LOC129596469 n=1 Tax=Paramacrobiotus metropolitanus TaxID=2943436 RepID=UPI00244654F4|nr:uncharacterized protein LOC129596469 [Paramacrobiotus metropolitanus]XP_055349737.1 uncharacterized protein LOC129596469 [Paramacrobiotus metropolitanus]